MLCNISQNAMGQPCGGGTLPGPAGGGTLPGGYPARGGTLPRGTLPGGYPAGGVPCRGGTQLGQQGVLATRRAVCLLRSRRRTFLLKLGSEI